MDMRKAGWIVNIVLTQLLILLAGCDKVKGPDLTGEINLSSQLFGSDGYYLFGYSYEDGEMYKYSYPGEPPLPDIINEGTRVIEDGETVFYPSFNTPAQVNGFALIGEFTSSENAREFYEDYDTVEEGLNFGTPSGIVELNQVWIQKTSSENYVKLLVRNISNFEIGSGADYNEIILEYTYQPDGSKSFPD